MIANTLPIGDKIRHFRMIKNLSQENMAELVGMSITGYAKIERNETNVSLQRISEIAKALGISLIELLSYGEKNFFYLSNHQENASNFVFNGNISEEIIALRHKHEISQKEIESLKMQIEFLNKEITLLKRLNEVLQGKQGK
ncbi:MAG: helix-turn-helix transcriptional regulator [Bernardetiaceae bacterium]|nr:helix-turn-helix transcriptional regulator [Bernardetiaceae bacterium]